MDGTLRREFVHPDDPWQQGEPAHVRDDQREDNPDPVASPPLSPVPPQEPESGAGLAQLLGSASGESKEWLRSVYDALPSDERRLITFAMQDVQPTAMYRIVRLALRQYEGVFDSARRQISIVGPVNAGKSSLFNALLLPKQPKAEVSPVPGTTREVQAGDAGLCTVIDTPGGDEAAGEERKQRAFEAAREADSLIVVFDASAGVNQGTRDLFDELRRLDKPMTLVLNKIDLVGKYEGQVVAKAARALGVSESDLIPISATKRINLEEVVFSLVRLNPALLALVSELLPQYRRQIANRYIIGAAISAFIVGSTPIPVADFFPLMAIQIGLVLQLGRVYGHRVSRDKAKEILLTLGGGVGLREGFRQTIKIVPVPIASWLVSGLYAALGTAALGMAAREYWAHGGIGSPSDWKRMADRFRRQLWTRFRSPGLLRRLDNRKQAIAVLEETLEGEMDEIDTIELEQEHV